MINEKLKDIFPFAYDYFSALLDEVKKKKRNFPQALIFEGKDTINQYLFAQELARNLNCTETNSPVDCSCINCNWIKNLNHPSIKNVSQIHSKPEDDGSSIVISAKQAKEISKELLLSSDYYRFYIFFSSREQNEEIEQFKLLGYKSEENFSIEPLKHSTFNAATPNILLKSIEEPPKNTCFIFLTTSRSEILQTIVSRCQCFKLSGKKEKVNYSNIVHLFSSYPNISYKNAIDISDNIQKLIKENNSTLELELTKLSEYLKDLLIQNPNLYTKISNDIKIVTNAIKQKKATMQDKIILDTMMFKLARGY